MKRFLLGVMIGMSFLFAGCNDANGDQTVEDDEKIEPKVEDHQREVGRIDAEVETFEFEDAVAQSDLIAQIEIVDVLKEVNEPSPKTIFRANIIEHLKGISQEQEIFVMQQGNCDFVFNGNPLFKQGENYFLFLMETVGVNIENSYWILGEETGMYKLLDQSIAVKLSVKEEQLKEIEQSDDKIIPFIEEKTELNMDEREMQVLKRDELKNLIKKLSEEGH